jgi:tetratricopeptide (TPR) repeat protein
MKRTLAAALVVLAVGAAAAVAYTSAARDREYRRLVAAGEAALTTQQTSVAIEAFSGAIALKPDAMLAHLKRGETYRQHGDLKAAFRDLRAASALDPSATRPLEQLGDVSLAMQRPDRAAERYAAYVRLDDRSPRVLYKLALAHYRAGQPVQALRAARQALALDDRFAEAHYLAGLCLTAQRQSADARKALEKAVTLNPALLPAREALAAAYRAAGRHLDATEQLEALAAFDRNRPARLIALGLEYADARRTDLAVATLGRAAERFPDSVDVYSTLGEVWLRIAAETEDRVALGKALEALREAVVRGGSSRELTLYGRAQLAAGDAPGALRSLREAAMRLPVQPATLLDLASAAERAGDRPQARDALRRHVALLAGATPPLPVARRIGDLSHAVGDDPEAVRWWRRAAAGSPDAALLAQLAAAEVKIGDRASAQQTVARALALDPDDLRARRLQAQLQSTSR